MPQSLSSILIHLVFSTKNRQRWLREDFSENLRQYLGGTFRGLECPCIAIGGVEDHLHVLFSQARTITTAKVVEEIKKSSSKWVKQQSPELADFAWQAGYGAFSIGQSQVDAVTQYIAHQPEHHRERSFQDEFRDILRKYGVAWDERYVWE